MQIEIYQGVRQAIARPTLFTAFQCPLLVDPDVHMRATSVMNDPQRPLLHLDNQVFCESSATYTVPSTTL